MKKTKSIIRRSIIVLAVILIAISLILITVNVVNATIRAEISNNGKEVLLYSTKKCVVDLTVEFSTGETIEQKVSLSSSSPTILTFENITSDSYKEYLEQNNATITNVVAENPDDGNTPVCIFTIVLIILVIIGFILDN